MLRFVAVLVAAAFVAAGAAQAQPTKELTLWTHWAAEQIKRQYVEEAIADFEKKNPGIRIKASWYEKNALYAALKTALRAGQAPDIFYAEPDQAEYYENSFLLDLSGLNWANIEPWAKQAWSYKGKPYGLPLEAWTVELYYNKKLMSDLDVKVPDSLQLSGDAFLDMVKKAKAKGIVPMSLGSGDRPFTGAHLTHEALLQKLGLDDYGKLLTGKLQWTDPRVVDALKWVRGLVDAGLLPTTFTSLKLGEAHIYFHTKPGALTFLVGSWYTSRAFNAPDQGGQPVGFPLGIMKFPAVPGAACPECRSIAVGGSYVINADTKHAKEAVAFLNTLRDTGDGQQVARSRHGADRHQRRSVQDQRAERRVLQDARSQQSRLEVLFRHSDPGDAGQAEGSVHAGHQHGVPGGHDRCRWRREADGHGLLTVI